MKAEEKSCGGKSCFELCYDILGQVISILDVVTDIIVCIQYYQNDRMIFFGISISILMLALIAYDMVFMINYHNEDKLYRVILLFFAMLPLSPFIPFIFYLSTDPQSKFSKFMENNCCFDIKVYNRIYKNKNTSKLKQFMEEKLVKHLGFIVEALVEGIHHVFISMNPCTH